MNYSRRDFGKLALAAIPAARALAAPNSRINGVQIGTISYSFRDLPVAQIVPAMVKIGLSEVELMSNHAEALAGAPSGGGGGNPALREWRASSNAATFQKVREQFTQAGIEIRLMYCTMSANITDDEIGYFFRMAQALGAKAISSTSTVTVARRVAPIAAKYRMMWGAHGHDNIKDPEEFATPETFAKIVAMGPYMGINLDIGHFTAAGFDAVPFIREHHARITNLHLKDRKKSPPGTMTPIQQNNWAWGEGDTPITAVLQLLKNEKYDIPANIEYEYNAHATSDTVTEVERCFAYAKRALA